MTGNFWALVTMVDASPRIVAVLFSEAMCQVFREVVAALWQVDAVCRFSGSAA